jgi:ABC-2 type transport system permease protein
MLKLLTATAKELLLLRRDRTGLLVLFLMPAILVVVITAVQENVMELTGQKKTRVVLLDLDQGDIGSTLREQLAKGNLEIVDWDGARNEVEDIRAAVLDGDYQVGIVLPEDLSARFRAEAARLAGTGGGTAPEAATPSIPVFFDPGTMAGLRSGITAQLRMALTAISLEEKLVTLDGMLKGAGTGLGMPPALLPLNGLELPAYFREPLLALQEDREAMQPTGTAPYNPVQQNVPAWALFGMFFTAIPIAGAILQERSTGIWIRLRALPVSQPVLFGGKVAAYMAVCLCQFLLIALIGAYLFPRIGLPAFTIAMNPPAVLLTVFFASLAACGYGIFLGMACTSYEQASTLGATTVVAAAAIGGVMVPVYAMPQVMQRISIISPLNWGLTAFQDLLLRGYSLSAVYDDLGRLLLFFVAATLLAWKLAAVRYAP